MGFPPSELEELARSILRMPGVSEVWRLGSVDEHSATLWILVRGFDEEAFNNRLAVRQSVEAFLADRYQEMRSVEFIFAYYVLVDEEGMGSPQIPSGAEQIAA